MTIENFVIPISESQSDFNAFTGYTDKVNNKNSHFVIWGQGNNFASFKDGDSKIILDFGSGFEFGKEYLISKLVTDKSGNSLPMLNVDFGRLTTRTSLYKLTQSGDNFIVSLDAPNSEIGILHKSNIRTMNNFYTISNSMIYPRKYFKSQNLGRKNSKNISSLLDLPTANRGNPKNLLAKRSNHLPYENSIDFALDSAFSLKSYESFAYQNESPNLQTRRIKRQNKRNYSRNLSNSQNLRIQSFCFFLLSQKAESPLPLRL